MLGREVSRKVPYMDRQTQIDVRAQKSNVDRMASRNRFRFGDAVEICAS
jgi:hypothetical protein